MTGDQEKNIKYIFKITCSEEPLKIDRNHHVHRKIKFVSKDDNKEIKLCGPYFGAYTVFKFKEGNTEEEFFKYMIHEMEQDIEQNWIEKGVRNIRPVPIEKVQVKVILDDNYEYQIALRVKNNDWITLPKASLFSENLNLKKYYNKNIKLVTGEKFDNEQKAYHYVPKIVCGEEEVCRLWSTPLCKSNEIRVALPTTYGAGFYTIGTLNVAVERDVEGKLLVYLCNEEGEPLNMEKGIIGVEGFDDKPFIKWFLRSALLESSDIREVLPELKIDDDLSLDKRKLKCLMSKTSNEVLKEEVINNLKSDDAFKQKIEGKQGPAGKDASAQDVAAQLMSSNNISTLVTEVAGNESLHQSVAGNQGLRTAVTTNLKQDIDFQAAVKGKQGDPGQNASAQDVAAQLMSSNNISTLVTEVADNQGLKDAVTTNLKEDTDFQAAVKGDPGKDASANAVAQELITNNTHELGQAVLKAKDTQDKEILVNSPALQEGVAKQLRENPGQTKGPPGDVSTIVESLKQKKFVLKRGEKLSEDIYEANIALNDKTIATLPKIGYYLLNDQLVIRNHVTKEEVAIPRDFHYLKVAKFGSGFGSDDYKLTFCNVLGNGFFEYKKYGPQYSNISDEYKFISLNYAKKEYNPNLIELFHPWPLFFITEGHAEPDSGKYSATVFELTSYGKGKKMATLIDEFGYFNHNDEFMYYNYHEGMNPRSYGSPEIDKEYEVTDANSAFYLAGNITIHTIPELY